MNRRLFAVLAAVLLCVLASCASAQTLYIDNREKDKVFPERLNFRAEPSAQGDLLAFLRCAEDLLEKSDDLFRWLLPLIEESAG